MARCEFATHQALRVAEEFSARSSRPASTNRKLPRAWVVAPPYSGSFWVPATTPVVSPYTDLHPTVDPQPIPDPLSATLAATLLANVA